jgi:hypothetical protein
MKSGIGAVAPTQWAPVACWPSVRSTVPAHAPPRTPVAHFSLERLQDPSVDPVFEDTSLEDLRAVAADCLAVWDAFSFSIGSYYAQHGAAPSSGHVVTPPPKLQRTDRN